MESVKQIPKTIQKSIDVDLHYSIFNDRFCETP